jgi:predicted PurR-regulated permease PerM
MMQPTATPMVSFNRFKIIQLNASLGLVLLFLWVAYQGFQGLFNEVLLVFGAYTFSFFILTWALHIQDLLNTCLGWVLRVCFRQQGFVLNRSLSIFMAYGVLSLIVVLVLLYSIPILSDQFQAVFDILKRSVENFEHHLDLWELGHPLPANANPLIASPIAMKSVTTAASTWVSGFKSLQTLFVKQAWQLASSSFTPLFYVFIGQIITFYLLLDGQEVTRFVVDLLPKVRHSKWGKALAFSQILMFRTVKAYTLSALLSGFFFWALCHAIGIPFAGVLSWCFGVLSFVPVLGPWLGVVPASLVLLTQGAEDKLFYLAIGVSSFGYLRAKYVSPQLFDKRYRFHPIWLILLWHGCFQLAGLLGVFLFIPLTVFLAMVGRFLLPKPASSLSELNT